MPAAHGTVAQSQDEFRPSLFIRGVAFKALVLFGRIDFKLVAARASFTINYLCRIMDIIHHC